jgi:hypothetical protein
MNELLHHAMNVAGFSLAGYGLGMLLAIGEGIFLIKKGYGLQLKGMLLLQFAASLAILIGSEVYYLIDGSSLKPSFIALDGGVVVGIGHYLKCIWGADVR